MGNRFVREANMKQSRLLNLLLIALLWATLSGCGRFYAVSKGEGRVGVSDVDDEAGRPSGRSIVADCVVTFYAADGVAGWLHLD